jgi:hypothetical protein
MSMLVTVITRQQPIQGISQICFGSRTRFHERNPSGGMRNEYVCQSVTPSSTECLQFV